MNKLRAFAVVVLFSLSTSVTALASGGKGNPITLPTPSSPAATMTSPTPGSVLGGSTVTFTWTNTGTQYLLYVGTTVRNENLDLVRAGTATTATVTNVPTAGATLYVTLFSLIAGNWVAESYTYTESGSPHAATMVSPTNGTTFASASQTFTWTPYTGATSYLLYVGTTAGNDNVDLVKTTSTTATVTNLPTNGKPLYVKLYSYVSGAWESNSYTYTAASAPATMLTPTPGSTLTGANVTFTWTNTGSQYLLYAGTAKRTDNIDLVNAGTATTATLTNIPTSGTTLYITLLSFLDGAWVAENYTYTESTLTRVVWVPDFYGGTLQVRVGAGASPTAVSVALPTCNPNAVAVNSNKAYVVCNAFGANPDKILVYNAATIRSAPAGALTISPTKTITSGEFNSLIGITFDASNNLWVASYGNSQVDEITAAELAATTPTVTAALIESPGSPVALAFDASGGLWISGQYSGGIVLHFPSDQVNSGDSGTPDYCLATVDVGAGCQFVDNVFLNPEGLALFNGDVWVANNATGGGGNVPGREIVDLKFAAGSITVNATFGSSTDATKSPFVCPGGLYAGTVHLWLNDESYGETDPQCGAGGDVASATGGVFAFTPAQLAAQTTTVGQVLVYSNITGRPGFGGIFVENDQ